MANENENSRYSYGWRPDLPDMRDLRYSAPLEVLQNLPARLDLRAQCPPIVDQGRLGSCTGNAIASSFYFSELKQQINNAFQPSRLFIYYNERKIEATIPWDCGASIRDGFKSINKDGVCSEELWTYDIHRFAEQPPAECYEQAQDHQTLAYRSLQQTLSELKGCLYEGYPFVFGFTVYDSFESDEVANTGRVPLPGYDEEVKGGHAVMAVGYDDSSQSFVVQNSWGEGWGDHGFFYMPYAYIGDISLARDFWTMRTVEG